MVADLISVVDFAGISSSDLGRDNSGFGKSICIYQYHTLVRFENNPSCKFRRNLYNCFLISKSSEQLTGFFATIKKPDFREALAIVTAQEKNPNRLISCTFNVGKKDQRTKTRIPSRHVRNKMEVELAELYEDMQSADFVQIIDLSER